MSATKLRIIVVWCAIGAVVIGHAAMALLSHRLRPQTSVRIALFTITAALLCILCVANAD